MGKTLKEIAQQLQDKNKKVQLIYAFNGTGKTRLSHAFKKLIEPQNNDTGESEFSHKKFLYYSAFTEDLFYWNNDLAGDTGPKLKIQPNSFTDWVLRDQGQDQNIITNFQNYMNDKLTPHFNESFTEVSFSSERGDNTNSEKIKISKGEESYFIWSIFYTLLDQVISILNVADPGERETDQFDKLEYIFIDDPVSSLDENHLIALAVDLAALIKSSKSNLKFIITTHNPLFYNVLCNELNKSASYLLERYADNTFSLKEKHGDSNQSFSYHLYLKQILERAIAENQIEKYHFTLLRNLYEKTASFLGYPKWSELLPDDKYVYFNRIIQFTSHSTLSGEAVAEPSPQEKQIVKFLLEHLITHYSYWQKKEKNG